MESASYGQLWKRPVRVHRGEYEPPEVELYCRTQIQAVRPAAGQADDDLSVGGVAQGRRLAGLWPLA